MAARDERFDVYCDMHPLKVNDYAEYDGKKGKVTQIQTTYTINFEDGTISDVLCTPKSILNLTQTKRNIDSVGRFVSMPPHLRRGGKKRTKRRKYRK